MVQKFNEVRDEKDEISKKLCEALGNAREERKLCEEEEHEARLKGEDVDRLRRERNEWRDYYDELIAGWTEEEHTEEERESRSTVSESTASVIGHGTPKISRKEADKITVPNWPKIHELEFWKSQVTSNIVAASGDLDHEAWIAWIAPTFKVSRY